KCLATPEAILKLYKATPESSNGGSINPLRHEGRKTEGLAVVVHLVCKGAAICRTKEQPAEPEYPEEGDERDRRIWRDRMDVYKVKYIRWEKQAKGLSDVNEYILTYLDPIHHLSLVAYRTLYDRLVYLKSRFARSTAYEEEIRMKWKVFAMQKPIGDIEEWL
ncbi:uncharacterized protein N7525_009115, partial [Penicillium rubens]|uniref:uncharacterized protein n=1 Tax=Penicillium rubens TaxID=1108849 RepID=UPI002A59E5EE